MMQQEDHETLAWLLTELMSAQGDVTHMNELSLDHQRETQKSITVRDGIKNRIIAFVSALSPLRPKGSMNKTQTMIAALIRDRATHMVADANEELARVHLDDTPISALETIQTLCNEAQAIVTAANELLSPAIRVRDEGEMPETAPPVSEEWLEHIEEFHRRMSGED